MSYIGKQLEVLDEHNNIIKTITVKGEREIGGVLTVTDEEGNLYTEDELNLSYVRTPECILWQALMDNNILEEDYTSFDFKLMSKALKDFMEGMEKAGYIAKDKNSHD